MINAKDIGTERLVNIAKVWKRSKKAYSYFLDQLIEYGYFSDKKEDILWLMDYLPIKAKEKITEREKFIIFS